MNPIRMACVAYVNSARLAAFKRFWGIRFDGIDPENLRNTYLFVMSVSNLLNLLPFLSSGHSPVASVICGQRNQDEFCDEFPEPRVI